MDNADILCSPQKRKLDECRAKLIESLNIRKNAVIMMLEKSDGMPKMKMLEDSSTTSQMYPQLYQTRKLLTMMGKKKGYWIDHLRMFIVHK